MIAVTTATVHTSAALGDEVNRTIRTSVTVEERLILVVAISWATSTAECVCYLSIVVP